MNLLRDFLFGTIIIAMAFWAVSILLKAGSLFLFKGTAVQHGDAIITDKHIRAGKKGQLNYYLQLRFADQHVSKLKVPQNVYDSCREGQRLIVGFRQPIGIIKRRIISIH